MAEKLHLGVIAAATPLVKTTHVSFRYVAPGILKIHILEVCMFKNVGSAVFSQIWSHVLQSAVVNDCRHNTTGRGGGGGGG